jgi:hypothetical protein
VLQRELGSALVGECPECGYELPLLQIADDKTALAPCPRCSVDPQKASAADELPRVIGTNVHEDRED